MKTKLIILSSTASLVLAVAAFAGPEKDIVGKWADANGVENTPIILAAGVYKLPDLLGPNGDGIRGQVLVGSVASGAAAYATIRFLSRYFRSGNLKPFGWYCLGAGALFAIRFA